MGDLGDPLAASLGKTSPSYVGKMCASHGDPVAPSAHKSALSLYNQDTFKTQTPARTHPQVPVLLCRIQPCSRHMLPWYHLLLTRKDDKTVTLLQLGNSALGCAGGTQLSRFNTASLDTAQSHQRVRTLGSQGSSWLPISEAGKLELCPPHPHPQVSTPEPPEVGQPSGVAASQWQS